MKRLTAHAVAVLVAFASASQGGDVFTFHPEGVFAKHQLLPRMAGKWLFLGCDSIVPVGIGLTNSDDTQYPYRIKTGRTLPKPAGACGRGEMIIVRNIGGVAPGALSLVVGDSVDDSTRSYRTSTDTVRVVTIRNDRVSADTPK